MNWQAHMAQKLISNKKIETKFRHAQFTWWLRWRCDDPSCHRAFHHYMITLVLGWQRFELSNSTETFELTNRAISPLCYLNETVLFLDGSSNSYKGTGKPDFVDVPLLWACGCSDIPTPEDVEIVTAARGAHRTLLLSIQLKGLVIYLQPSLDGTYAKVSRVRQAD